MIEFGARDLGLGKACPGSNLYTELFVEQKKAGYVSIPEEDGMNIIY